MNEEEMQHTIKLLKMPVMARTNQQHHFLIEEVFDGKVRDYLLSMGKFKDINKFD